ncbi:SIR2 family NAD-dependent protein deacylase [Stackebrandtia nassauensis]|uniref:protein acetyllysine N-acetyltransferase n=1 Tax=Stackebrandtia nassauensis (strain DSM 44728 / CIP 108903 / NRRL B-16338 / NBRC 102104 / LLR-40K-21) TaxID=446470 RepID=D3Q5P5_STANL|nr:Sir2 family NAD-dependent protein deacetylase [Stackebrandtia nassauensis]ADD40194.1 Silent information regulator protein Sir2 [Stackebrandtia nassauensis DSM 44728]
MDEVSLSELAPLKEYSRVVVLTGAGISRPSGLPTYRGDDGTWNDPEAARAAEADTVGTDLAAVWRLWGGLAHLAAAAQPNPAHRALAGAEESLLARTASLLVVTQNVDGLHQRGGQRDVIELHGNAHRQRCLDAGCALVAPYVGTGETIPSCAGCGGRARPDIVLFGEQLDLEDLERAWNTAAEADLLLAVGTSCGVSPAANLVAVARQAGALCVALTREPLPFNPGFHAAVTGLAERELPRWVAETR